MIFLSPLAGIHTFTSLIPRKGNLKILTCKFNLHVKGNVYTVTGLVFSSKLLNITRNKQRHYYTSHNTNTKASKIMTAVCLFVMLMHNMWLGPDKQDQVSVLCITFFSQELKNPKHRRWKDQLYRSCQLYVLQRSHHKPFLSSNLTSPD